MNHSKIVGTGRYLPELVISNDKLATMMDTSDEWIYSRTGIRHRHIADQQTTYEMAAIATRHALTKAQLDVDEIELLIVATISGEYQTPSIACLVQKELGAINALCFDVNAACSGFVYALDVADQYIRTGKYKNAVIIGVEKLSQIVNWEDRSTCVLFGDGAGVAIIKQSCELGVIDTINRSIGEDFQCLYAKLRHNDTPFYKFDNEHHLIMNGQEVFQFACKKVPEIIREVLEKNNMDISEIHCFILHQANKRIVDRIAKVLKVDIEKFYTNMDKYGNTSSASIPIALDELLEQNDLSGKKVILAGFGAGLTYGATVVQL